MASAMVAPSSSPVFSPSLFRKTGLTMMPLPSPPSSPLPLLFHQQSTDHKIDRSAGTTSSSLLRRKRPASLALPTNSFEYSCTADVEPSGTTARKFKEEEVEVEVEAEGEGYGVYSKKGRKRGPLEDRFSAVFGDHKEAFFGVFDGHGGANAAEFAAKRLGKKIMDQMSRRSSDSSKVVRDGYLATDSAFMDEEDASGGACCVTALIREGDVIVSNVGDCRAVMSRGGVSEALTSDHKPSVQSERSRIQHSGGFVDCYRGVWRIQGTLAVSRSIGDKHLKTWVTAEPDTMTLRITSGCEFLILASDGLWDKVTNQEAVHLVRPLLCMGVEKPNPSLAAKRLAELSIRRGSLDDTTVLIVTLDQFIS